MLTNNLQARINRIGVEWTMLSPVKAQMII